MVLFFCGTGSVPAAEFEALAQLLASALLHAQVANLGIMQLGAAAAAALGGERGARWEAAGRAEQALIAASSQGGLPEASTCAVEVPRARSWRCQAMCWGTLV